jgi:hypothetical protein
VDRSEIVSALEKAEASVEAGSGLAGTGFWKAVGAVKRDPSLVEEFADRTAVIDRRAFEQWAFFTIPAAIGTALAVLGTIAGLVIIFFAYYVDDPWSWMLLLLGTGITLVTTHGLGHLVVGSLTGMRFTHWFIGKISQPQPGVKVDYATYLRAPATSRAWMHAAGAIVTKTIPFLALGPALVIPAPGWVTALLIIGAIAMIVTDIAWSTKSSDWKKFKREMGYVR